MEAVSGSITRRDLLLGAAGFGAAAMAANILHDSHAAGATGSVLVDNIQGPVDSQGLQPAVRLNPPKRELSSPWIPGETIYDVPNSLGYVLFRGDDGPWLDSSLQTDAIFTSFGLRGRASFAWVAGLGLKNNQDVGRELYAAGYDIINHSLTHSHYDDKNNALEIEPADELFGEILGYVPETYAGPGLIGGPLITAEMTRLGKCATSTRVFIGDTDQPALDKDQIIARAKAQIKSGSIIVYHPETGSHEATRRALPYIIQNLLDAGLVPVNLKDFLRLRYDENGERRPEFPPIRIEGLQPLIANRAQVS